MQSAVATPQKLPVLAESQKSPVVEASQKQEKKSSEPNESLKQKQKAIDSHKEKQIQTQKEVLEAEGKL